MRAGLPSPCWRAFCLPSGLLHLPEGAKPWAAVAAVRRGRRDLVAASETRLWGSVTPPGATRAWSRMGTAVPGAPFPPAVSASLRNRSPRAAALPNLRAEVSARRRAAASAPFSPPSPAARVRGAAHVLLPRPRRPDRTLAGTNVVTGGRGCPAAGPPCNDARMLLSPKDPQTRPRPRRCFRRLRRSRVLTGRRRACTFVPRVLGAGGRREPIGDTGCVMLYKVF